MAKTEKVCIVCGNDFNGTAKAECCGSNCRVKLKRLLEKGEQPKFRLVGGKNTQLKKPEIKIQDLNKPTNQVTPITDQKPTTNISINTSGNKPKLADILRGMGYEPATKPKPYTPLK